jgi:hypothetical protein
MLDDLEKTSREIKNRSLVIISFKYGCHMLTRLIKIIYRIYKL